MQPLGGNESHGLGAYGPGRPDPRTDNLSQKYAAVVDDSTSPDRKRQASMLFLRAEGQIAEGMTEEGLASARDAVSLFREAEDLVGRADSIRLAMHAVRLRAAEVRADGRARESIGLLEDAESQLQEELVFFEEAQHQRGQAAVHLALAEVQHALGSSPLLAEALDNLLAARDLARQVQDTKLEALTAHERAAVLQSKHHFKSAVQAAKEAAAYFRQVADMKNEGFALYSLGAAEVNCGRVEEGLRCKAKALKLWKQTGDRRLQAVALSSLAEWHILAKEDFQAGIAFAAEASELCRALGDRRGEATAHAWLVQAHIRNKDTSEALQVASSGMEEARGRDDRTAMFHCLEALTHACLGANDSQAALEAAEESIELAQELEDKRYHARALELAATVHLSSSNFTVALERAQASVEVMRNLDGFEAAAFQSMQFLARVLMQKGDYKEALRTLERARTLAQRVDDTYLEAVALLGMSGGHALVGDTALAVKAATLARELFREEGYSRGEARVLKASSEFYMQQGNYTAAVRTATEGAILMEDCGDNTFAAHLRYTLASLHLHSERFADAARAATDGLKLARLGEDKRSTVQMMFVTLEANNAILQGAAVEEKMTKTFKQGIEKMKRLAKEAIGISVKIKDAGLEAAANYWVGHLFLMEGRAREGIEAGARTAELAREACNVALEVRASVLSAHAHVALGEQDKAIQVLTDAITTASNANDGQSKSMADGLLKEIVGLQQQSVKALPAMGAQQQEVATEKAEAEPTAAQVYKPPESDQVKQFILGLVQNMTGSSEEVDGDTPLMESGIDSLASVELRTSLQQEFNLKLPSTVMFNYPTITGMTDLLVEEMTNKEITWG